jgi:hypothetical protein
VSSVSSVCISVLNADGDIDADSEGEAEALLPEAVESPFKAFRVFGPTNPHPALPVQAIFSVHWNFSTAARVRLPKNPVAYAGARSPFCTSNDCSAVTWALRSPKYNDCVIVAADGLGDVTAAETGSDPTDAGDGMTVAVDTAVSAGVIILVTVDVGETAPFTSVAATAYP